MQGRRVFLWRAHAGVYRLLRTSILVVWAVALPIYALFPTAPPRLVVIGSLGTVSAAKPMTLDSGVTRVFYNPYAAVPSLHVAVAVLVGVAFALAARRRWVRLSVLAWPLLVTVAVVATGNHYLFDVAAGVVLALLAAALTALVIPGGVRGALSMHSEGPAGDLSRSGSGEGRVDPVQAAPDPGASCPHHR